MGSERIPDRAITASAHSHVGLIRRANEDSFVAKAPVFVVADGMGGHARGDRASQEAVRVLARRLRGRRLTAKQVLRAIDAANAAVRALSTAEDAGVAVACTTLAGLVRVIVGADGAQYWMAINVGDSRIYSWNGRDLAQVSVDHSAVQELVDAGELSEPDSRAHPDRNVVTRALGAADSVDADVWLLPVRGQQTFLVCSDGLTRELDDRAIAAILGGDGPAWGNEPVGGVSTAERLVAAAVAAGGHDNVTAIVIESLADDEGAALAETRDRPDAQRQLEETRPRG